MTCVGSKRKRIGPEKRKNEVEGVMEGQSLFRLGEPRQPLTQKSGRHRWMTRTLSVIDSMLQLIGDNRKSHSELRLESAAAYLRGHTREVTVHVPAIYKTQHSLPSLHLPRHPSSMQYSAAAASSSAVAMQDEAPSRPTYANASWSRSYIT